MSQANVRSVDALKDFKNALIAYAEEARNALSGVDMDVRRTRDWLERDQLMYWQTQVKKRNEQVSQARADLFRRQISQSGDNSVSDSDQKEALRLAIMRLRQAEEKLEKVRRWGPVLQHAISEYNSAARPLGDRLAGDLVSSLALLDRMVASLDAYMALKAPTLREEKTSTTGQAESATASVGNAAPVAQPVSEGDARPEDGEGASPADGDTDPGAPSEEKPNEREVVTP